jgi:ubiquinone/menaquinone biosynthesis C-methylase UbiE
MIRHLQSHAARAEMWGLDISAPHINWLKTHLSPPFYFAVNTTIPHLPFPDDYFGLVYCGSLFTHIDDLAETWFLEIRRTLLPGGLLYCTLHDEHTVAVLDKGPYHPLARVVRMAVLANGSESPPDILITGRDSDSNMFYHSRYLKPLLSRLFEIKAVAPSAYGYQSAWVLRKR